jgi:hypothetical protein
MIPSPVHPGESRDPVLSSVTPAFQDGGRGSQDTLQHPKNWVPAFAGMNGFKGAAQ